MHLEFTWSDIRSLHLHPKTPFATELGSLFWSCQQPLLFLRSILINSTDSSYVLINRRKDKVTQSFPPHGLILCAVPNTAWNSASHLLKKSNFWVTPGMPKKKKKGGGGANIKNGLPFLKMNSNVYDVTSCWQTDPDGISHKRVHKAAINSV